MAKDELATYLLLGTALSDTKSLGKIDMNISAPESSDTGLEVIDIQGDAACADRRIRVHHLAKQDGRMERITHAFIEDPESSFTSLLLLWLSFRSAALALPVVLAFIGMK
jgi:hypothetical protein